MHVSNEIRDLDGRGLKKQIKGEGHMLVNCTPYIL